MARKPKRDLTVEEQLARGPLDLPFLMLTMLLLGVVTNLIPNTGISLPFFSYGGTALMIQLAEMGIVLSISRQIPAPKND